MSRKPFANPLKLPSFGRAKQLFHPTLIDTQNLSCNPSPLKLDYDNENKTPDELRRARNRQIENQHFGSRRYVKLLRAGGAAAKHRSREHSLSANQTFNNIAPHLVQDPSLHVAPFPSQNRSSHRAPESHRQSFQESPFKKRSSEFHLTTYHKKNITTNNNINSSTSSNWKTEYPSSTTIPSCGTETSAIQTHTIDDDSHAIDQTVKLDPSYNASVQHRRSSDDDLHFFARPFEKEFSESQYSGMGGGVESIQFKNKLTNNRYQRRSVPANYKQHLQEHVKQSIPESNQVAHSALSPLSQTSTEAINMFRPLNMCRPNQGQSVGTSDSFHSGSEIRIGVANSWTKSTTKTKSRESKLVDTSNIMWQNIERKASLLCGEKSLEGLTCIDRNSADELPARVLVLSRCTVGVNGNLERSEGVWLEEQLCGAIDRILLRLEIARRRQGALERENYRLRQQLKIFINVKSQM